MGSNRKQHGDDNLSEWGRSGRQEERRTKQNRFERESIEDSIQSNEPQPEEDALTDPDAFLRQPTQEERRLAGRKRRRGARLPKKHVHQWVEVSSYPLLDSYMRVGITVRMNKCILCKKKQCEYDWSRK